MYWEAHRKLGCVSRWGGDSSSDGDGGKEDGEEEASGVGDVTLAGFVATVRLAMVI